MLGNYTKGLVFNNYTQSETVFTYDISSALTNSTNSRYGLRVTVLDWTTQNVTALIVGNSSSWKIIPIGTANGVTLSLTGNNLTVTFRYIPYNFFVLIEVL